MYISKKYQMTICKQFCINIFSKIIFIQLNNTTFARNVLFISRNVVAPVGNRTVFLVLS